MRLFDDKDITAIQAAFSQVVKDAIGQTAAVLVPAIERAAKGALSGVTVTVGPIVIEPIQIKIGMEKEP
jgi:hypothetical protein